MNILIVEDDLLIAEMLKRMLKKLNHNVCQICTDFNAAISFLEVNSDLDLVFLDINLESDKSGIDVGEVLNNTYRIPFVYLTSYSDPKTIQSASKTLPESYLTKPFNETSLFTTLEIIKEKLEQKVKVLVIKESGNIVKIKIKDILFVKKEQNYIELYTEVKRYVIRQSINTLIEDVNDSNFVRTHRSYAVQLTNVESIKNQTIKIGKYKIPLSRSYKDEITKKFWSLEN